MKTDTQALLPLSLFLVLQFSFGQLNIIYSSPFQKKRKLRILKRRKERVPVLFLIINVHKHIQATIEWNPETSWVCIRSEGNTWCLPWISNGYAACVVCTRGALKTVFRILHCCGQREKSQKMVHVSTMGEIIVSFTILWYWRREVIKLAKLRCQRQGAGWAYEGV